ncbi:HesB/IscA family protein [Candidatus Venteria ishoeyi]|uniref:Iron-sulfur cluster insertion protein ErpA n=1 Tax=Candidatus Venteria ishoeyi TaxID=1899563 RepID=A0A1H6FF80_9GAMM|nr:iron-sulfur cluster assembly accessory protein [Candidatus Venteria ishoeyi]MDM8546143.1 Fe-S cluster assembly protein HesB [Candidatus Venteria ishoeyi]SEH08009.1 Iron-sulfur cluster insertion protein ErpA [Candidatus Venteria ishoeyi]
MFKLTEHAAQEIAKSAQDGAVSGLKLRIAAKKNPDGSIEYGMGFDQAGVDDQEICSQDIDLIIASVHLPLLEGTTMDYVEIEPGQFAFIFLNPNDANYQPPATEDAS